MYGSATARPGARFKLDTIPRRETVQLSASLHRFGSQSNVQKDGAKRMWLNSISEWAIAKILLMSVWPRRNWKRGTYLGMGNGDYAVQLPTARIPNANGLSLGRERREISDILEANLAVEDTQNKLATPGVEARLAVNIDEFWKEKGQCHRPMACPRIERSLSPIHFYRRMPALSVCEHLVIWEEAEGRNEGRAYGKQQ
ncbi:hypothetical protein DFH06DRAFT_1150017 [Mycena polygramma]|nr:hypothetical protein DFH06DRAFT_1150017 [Mycena polygramma]